MTRFPALTTIGILLKGLAGLIVLVGFFAGVNADGGGQLILIWVAAAINAIFLFAFAELIGVFLAIEDNTRQTNRALQSTTPSSAITPQPKPETRLAEHRVAGPVPSWLTPRSKPRQ